MNKVYFEGIGYTDNTIEDAIARIDAYDYVISNFEDPYDADYHIYIEALRRKVAEDSRVGNNDK